MTAAIVVLVIMAVLIGVQEWIHRGERQDLYNRLMARDLPEYKAMDRAEAPKGRNGLRKVIKAHERKMRVGE